MNQLYLEPFSGVSGDMLVAALLDLGADSEAMEEAFSGLPEGLFRWRRNSVQRQSLHACQFEVESLEAPVHRGYRQVLELVQRACLGSQGRVWAQAAVEHLATAEAKVHGVSPQEVHFHEVGAIDTVVDIVASCALLESLQVGSLWSAPVAVGSGLVDCDHGRYPVPAPGTLEILQGMPLCGHDLPGERTTPTGAALLKAWQVRFEGRPAAMTMAVGYGAGQREDGPVPNVLRLRLEQGSGSAERLWEYRCLLDDLSGEYFAAAMDSLRRHPALVDLWCVAVTGKKGRPAFELVALVEASGDLEFERHCFEELGVLGFRRMAVDRVRRPRRTEIRSSPFGDLPFKIRKDPDGEESLKPEFEALRKRAEQLGKTPRQLLSQWLKASGSTSGQDEGAAEES
ncbi:MAG: nickel pincer cofactor biosynthesis protein LarC [Planctomycetota bacterium]|nr:MAG: nickel pincer cofactor biosynthesis protein LarC [Planctomycetota bacterium]